MKKKLIISVIAACLLLTGCAQNGSSEAKSPKINYSDMFRSRSDESATSSKKNTATKSASPDTDNDSDNSADNKAVNDNAADEKQTVHRSQSANGTVEETKQSDNKKTKAGTQDEANNSSNTQKEENKKPSVATRPKVFSNEAVKAIENRRSSSVIFTDNQSVANLPFRDICYFPYKTASELKPPNENVVQPKEPEVSNNNGTLTFTPGVLQSAADDMNKLSDSKVKEIKDVIENISAIADEGSGFNTETKFYVTPNVPISQNFSDKSMSFDLTFKDANDKDIQPQKNVTVKIPVPSRLNNSSNIYVYHVGDNGKSDKIASEIQTDGGVKYAVFETNRFSTYILTNAEVNNSDTAKPTQGSNKNTSPKEIKYDHGYQVVFRTETDTYLLGIFPHDYCKWDEVNDMCREIEGMIEAECQMVGIPSLEDLQYFTDCGIYLPGQYEMWTSTSASPNSAYFRNNKGAFYSTKSKSKDCGVCAIIRISAPQTDASLLSSSLPNYAEAKARLEAEEEQYKLSISE